MVHKADYNPIFNLIATPMGSFGGGWPHRIIGTHILNIFLKNSEPDVISSNQY